MYRRSPDLKANYKEKDGKRLNIMIQSIPTMREFGCIHIGNPSPDISWQDIPIGSHGSTESFSISQGQAEGQPVQSG